MESGLTYGLLPTRSCIGDYSTDALLAQFTGGGAFVPREKAKKALKHLRGAISELLLFESAFVELVDVVRPLKAIQDIEQARSVVVADIRKAREKRSKRGV